MNTYGYTHARQRAQAQAQLRRSRRKSRIFFIIIIALSAALVSALIANMNSAAPGDPPNDPAAAAVMAGADDATPTVCIDAGHGYDDPGTSSEYLGGLDEKDINLAVAKKLAALLENAGCNVIMTRISDTPPDSIKANEYGQYLFGPNLRTAFANDADIDLFISIHSNALENSDDMTGTQVYYYAPSSAGALSFAESVTGALAAAFPGRSVEAIATKLSNTYAVIRDITVPSVLVELGYVTTESDAALLIDDAWQDEAAAALADGIKDALGIAAK